MLLVLLSVIQQIALVFQGFYVWCPVWTSDNTGICLGPIL